MASQNGCKMVARRAVQQAEQQRNGEPEREEDREIERGREQQGEGGDERGGAPGEGPATERATVADALEREKGEQRQERRELELQMDQLREAWPAIGDEVGARGRGPDREEKTAPEQQVGGCKGRQRQQNELQVGGGKHAEGAAKDGMDQTHADEQIGIAERVLQRPEDGR